jgi:glycine/D-amino acid oxidase-like deaminating enzyme
MNPPVQLDALLVGGGIAGMWTLHAMRKAGHAVWLVEADALGAGQTMQSQGIIHGGLKYALGGTATTAAAAIATMPDRWHDALQNELNTAHRRADDCLLWSTGGLGRLGLLGARMTLRAKPSVVDDIPDILNDVPRPVLRVEEPVLEPASVLQAFADGNHDALIRCDGPDALRLQYTNEGIEAHITCAGETLHVRARRVVLLAGGGNAALRSSLDLSTDAMQTRPLRMVMARGRLPVLNGHVIKGTAPWLTITSTHANDGTRIWQIGGEVAEAGARQSAADTIAIARKHLARALPSLDATTLELATYSAPRAEGRTGSGQRPDTPTLLSEGPVLTGWPTKFALAPLLSDQIIEAIDPPQHTMVPVPMAAPRPAPAAGPWENDELWNSEHSAALK